MALVRQKMRELKNLLVSTPGFRNRRADHKGNTQAAWLVLEDWPLVGDSKSAERAAVTARRER